MHELDSGYLGLQPNSSASPVVPADALESSRAGREDADGATKLAKPDAT